jgi:hypothetical protein
MYHIACAWHILLLECIVLELFLNKMGGRILFGVVQSCLINYCSSGVTRILFRVGRVRGMDCGSSDIIRIVYILALALALVWLSLLIGVIV